MTTVVKARLSRFFDEQLSLLIRQFESNVSTGADTHQRKQGSFKLRHRKLVINFRQEYKTEHYRPRKNLKTVEAYAVVVA